MKSIILIIITCSVLISAQNKINVNEGDTLKIHPLGDSITRGKEGDTYRHYLKTKLRNEAHLEIDFVGQCPHAADVGATWENSTELFEKLEGDVEHDGWGGLTIEQLTDMTTNTKGYPKVTIEKLLEDSPSDIILLMIGTNNEFFVQYSKNAVTNLKILIGRILNSTNSNLIVSTIPPTDTTVLPLTSTRINSFNSEIPAIVDSFKVLGKNISFIDINSYMSGITDLTSDDCHPNSLGNENIANGWYNAIMNLVTDVKDEKKNTEIPIEYGLSQNYPNPFNPVTKIEYSIPNRSHVTINVFDILSNEISTLVNSVKERGNYEIYFDASKLASGIYFYTLKTKDFTHTKKMLLLK